MDPKTCFLTVPFQVDVGRPPKTARSRQNPYQKSPQIFFGGSGPKKSIFGVPTWPPKSYQNPLRGVPGALPVPKGRPEPSGEPFWRHFGSILAPFWCDFGTPLPLFLILLLTPPALLFSSAVLRCLFFFLRLGAFLCHLWASALRSRALAREIAGLALCSVGL